MYWSRTAALHEALCSALSSMPSRPDPGLAPVKSDDTVFITKWIDYSNKYGFGFQLSDKSVGVLFNDNTRISYSFDRRSALKHFKVEPLPLALCL